MATENHLVLLPGSLCDEAVWDHQAEAFSDDWTVLAPHLVGHPTIESMASAALSQAPPHFSLVGFSMGGRVALEMMRRAPARIQRLALLDTSVHPVADGEALRRQELIDLAFEKGMETVARSWLPRLVHPSRRNEEALMNRLIEMACRFTPAEYREEVNALLNRPDPRPVLDEVRCPVLVLSGRQDPLSTPERNLEIARRVGAPMILLDDCGHFPMLEAPEATNDALRSWLLRT